MIALSVAAVKLSFDLKREREEESVHRANQYVRAIREFYLKFGRYPGSVDQLVDTNNIRFLRQKYVDPLTGKADYRLIIVGQNKTTPKGFFGEALTGLPGARPGAGAGASTPAGGTANSAAGGFGNGFGSNTATMGFGGGGGVSAGIAAGGQASGGAGAVVGQSAAAGPSNPGAAGSTSTTAGSGGPGSNLGPIMGVGSSATGASIISVNEQTSYEDWEFLYDPRVERLRQQGQLNSGVGTTGGNANPAGLGGSPQPGASGSGFAPGGGFAPAAGGTNVPAGGTPSNGTQP